MKTVPELLRRVRCMVWIVMVGLVISGATAIPLETELNFLTRTMGLSDQNAAGASGVAHWIWKVQDGLRQTSQRFPFMAYGTDWLAFGHFVIALAFVGALRDPVRNAWLFDFGLLACAMVIPFALVFGQLRGIPLLWRLMDSAFGVFGAIPLWLARKWTRELSGMQPKEA
jgi:hypothetical protein